MSDIIEFVAKMILAIFIIAILSSCVSTPTPIIIRDIPKCDVSSDMSIEQYMQSSTTWAVEITAYTKELINQIEHKANYIDLRK